MRSVRQENLERNGTKKDLCHRESFFWLWQISALKDVHFHRLCSSLSFAVQCVCACKWACVRQSYDIVKKHPTHPPPFLAVPHFHWTCILEFSMLPLGQADYTDLSCLREQRNPATMACKRSARWDPLLSKHWLYSLSMEKSCEWNTWEGVYR